MTDTLEKIQPPKFFTRNNIILINMTRFIINYNDNKPTKR